MFSAMGSFFIPMIVMLYVYARISCVIASRHDQMSEIKVHQKSTRIRHDEDCDYDSESDHKTQQIRKRFSDQMSQPNLTVNKTNMTPYNNSSQNIRDMYYKEPSEPQNGHYELVDINNPLTPNLKRNPTITYKLSNIKPQWSSDSIQMNENVRRTTSSNISLQQHHNNQQALHQQHSHPHHNNQFNRSVRTQQKTLSTRISSLKRESKTAQTLSIVVGGLCRAITPIYFHYSKLFPHFFLLHRFHTLLASIFHLLYNNTISAKRIKECHITNDTYLVGMDQFGHQSIHLRFLQCGFSGSFLAINAKKILQKFTLIVFVS